MHAGGSVRAARACAQPTAFGSQTLDYLRVQETRAPLEHNEAAQDVSRMVTEKDQSNAAKDVRVIIEKDPETFSHRVTKACFEDG